MSTPAKPLGLGEPLTPRGLKHLEFLRQVEPGRRLTIDGPGRIMAARDALFCAASNLECGVPQQQKTIAGTLRETADLLVELDAAASDLATLRNIIRMLTVPELAKAASALARAQRTLAEGGTP